MAGLSGGARGLPAGRPGAAGPGEWVAWGKGRELSPLKTHSYPPAASCPAPGIRAAPALPLGPAPGGLRRQVSLSASCVRLPHPGVSAAAPSPRCRGARAPSQAPRASLRATHWEFPPRLPQVPLSSPGFPQILTPPHAHSPLRRGSTSGLSPCQLFFMFRGSPCSLLRGSRPLLSPWAPPPLGPAGTVPRLGDRVPG